uniref:Carboxypeptidase n=1 Tax=Palpitomonas bilix TaxID=652834 RepID=A0A7S3D2V7_9EUKA
MPVTCFWALLLAVGIASCLEPDKLGILPGQNFTTSYHQYAGYLTVRPETNGQIFYWYAESQSATPGGDPLVLWLNGGPGCSSVAGFWGENGPFHLTKEGVVVNNPLAWNKVANMLWLESPLGVGFSRSSSSKDFYQNDTSTAVGNFVALQSFLKKFPEFKGRDFYVFGESYAGHYIPTLIDYILDNKGDLELNLKGFGIGNPTTDRPSDFNAPLPFYRNHALISPQSYQAAYKACNGDFMDTSTACVDHRRAALKEYGSRINIYDILADVCLDGEARGENEAFRMMSIMYGDDADILTPPCIAEYLATYLNRADVKAAIHADPSIKWVQCSDTVDRVKYTYSYASMLPLYARFLNETSLRVLIFSGDIDSVLPFTGTQAWIDKLDRPIKRSWAPWLDSEGQTGGYKVEYDRMTFITIRGAGHMVPEFRPQRAFDFFSRFLAGKAI